MQLLDRLSFVIAGVGLRDSPWPIAFSAQNRKIGRLGAPFPLANGLKTNECNASIISIDGIGASLNLRTCLCDSGTITITLPTDALVDGTWHSLEEVFSVFDASCLPKSEQLQLHSSMTGGDTLINITYAAGLTMPANKDFVQVGVEQIQITSAPTNNGSFYSYSCLRGVGGTRPAPHYVSTTTGYKPDVTYVTSVWIGRIIYLYLDGEIWRRGILSSVPSIEDGVITIEFVAEDNRASDMPPTLDSLPLVGLFDDHVVTTPEYYGTIVRKTDRRLVWCETSGVSGRLLVKYQDDRNSLKTELSPESYNSYNQYEIGTQGAKGSPQNPEFHASITNAKYGIIERFDGNYIWLANRSGTILTTPTTSGEAVGLMLVPWSRLYCSELPVGSVLLSASGLEQYAFLPTIQFARQLPSTTSLTNEPFLEGYGITQNPGNAVYLKNTVIGGDKMQIGICYAENLPNDRFGEYYPNYTDVSEALVAGDGSGITKLTARVSSGRISQTDENLIVSRAYQNALGNCVKPGWLCRYPVRSASNNLSQSSELISDDSHVIIDWLDVEPEDYVRIPVVCALRWWERGFSDLRLAEEPLGDPSFPNVRATWYEPDGSARTCDLSLTDNYDGNGGYNYKVKHYRFSMNLMEPVGIGDWPGQPRATFCPICGQSFVTGGYALLSLLASIDSTTGTTIFDRLPAGCGAVVDSLSFNSFADPAGVESWSWAVGGEDDVSAADFVSSVLLVSRTAIVGDPNKSYKLTRVSIGNPTRAELAQSDTITDDLIIGTPSSDTDRDVVTSYEMQLPNKTKISWMDQDAIQRYGEGSSLKLDLTQANLDASGAIDLVQIFRGMLGSLCETYGRAKRIWRITIPIENCEKWYIGQPVSVSSKYLYGYDTSRGVEAAPATITEIDMHPTEGTADLVLWARRQIGGAYDIGCLIFYASGTTLYTMPLEVSPDGTTHDASFFKAGDVVRINLLTAGVFDRTISTISTFSTYDRIDLTSSVTSGSAAVMDSAQGLVELVDPTTRAVPYFLVGIDSFC